MYCFRDTARYLSKVALVCLLITTVRPIKTDEPIETSCDSGARETTRYMEGRDSQRKRYIILRFSAHWKALDFRLHSTHARGRLPRTSQTTVAFCRTLVVAHCGLTPMICGSCSCREHITNSVTGVSRPMVLDCGTTFHLDYGGLDLGLPSTPSDNL